MPFPATLNAKPKIIFFTDFDGTVTANDCKQALHLMPPVSQQKDRIMLIGISGLSKRLPN